MNSISNNLKSIFLSAIESVKPQNFIPEKIAYYENMLIIENSRYNLSKYKNIYIIGFGKASSAMSVELEKILGDKITGGLILTKYGHTDYKSKIKTLESSHPLPDDKCIENTKALLEYLKKTVENDLILVLVSGGGSALLEQPEENIFLNDLINLNSSLLKCGVSIFEINYLRKFISKVKGGQLLNYIYPADFITLIISDVVGDPPETIASGPTIPQALNSSECRRIIEKYELNQKLPSNIASYISSTKEKSTLNLKSYNTHILMSNIFALKQAEKTALSLGFNTLILSSKFEGDTTDLASFLFSIAEEINSNEIPLKKPACIISGGETTVKINGNGKGGRNQEFVLAFINKLYKKNIKNIAVASIGTDGTDGPTDAAGAFWNCDNFEKNNVLLENADFYLQNNDSYNFFELANALVKTGPTGTNVMDVRIIIIT